MVNGENGQKADLREGWSEDVATEKEEEEEESESAGKRPIPMAHTLGSIISQHEVSPLILVTWHVSYEKSATRSNCCSS